MIQVNIVKFFTLEYFLDRIKGLILFAWALAKQGIGYATKLILRWTFALAVLAVVLGIFFHYTSAIWIPIERYLVDKVTANVDIALSNFGYGKDNKVEGILITPSREDDGDKEGVTYAESVAADEGVLPTLVYCVAQTETNWDHTLTSSAGARGLMQVMPANADFCDTTPDGLYKEKINSRCGVKILKSNLERWNGDPVKALRAYNASEKCYSGKCPTVEIYVNKVLACVARKQNEGRFLMVNTATKERDRNDKINS